MVKCCGSRWVSLEIWDRLSVQVMRCSDDASSCHDLVLAERLVPGDYFVLVVTGYDALGFLALPATELTEARCEAGPAGAWPSFRLRSDDLRSYDYGTTQAADRGYAGCAVRVVDDAAVGPHGVTVSYVGGDGTSLTVQVSVVVVADETGLSYLLLSGPTNLESGESGSYTLYGTDAVGLLVDSDEGCVSVSVTGALEHDDVGTDGCAADGVPASGFHFMVRAADGLVYETDSSVSVSYGGHSVRQHVLAVPAVAGDVASPSVSDSHISDLTITQEDTQLKISWVSNPTSEFASLRAQGWVVVGGVDVFLPGCGGGDVLETNTYEVFCLLSYGQTDDVYHAAVGFFRWDGSAVPVETAEWTRP